MKAEDFRPIRFGKLDQEERWDVFGNSQKWLCSDEGIDARKFLLDRRQLDLGTVAEFRVGYVPLRIDHDFAGRLVMPIFDCYNNLLALSVRPLLEDKEELKKVGKYWNESYDKGNHLFGLNLAKYWIVKWGFAILVEGQMDTMAMHSFGMPNTVGVLGGAFTPFHAMLIKRWTNQLVLLFDGDAAGRADVVRAREILSYYDYQSPGRRKPRNVFKHMAVKLPGESDPNDYLCKKGSLGMKEEIMRANGDAVSMGAHKLAIPDEWQTEEVIARLKHGRQ